MRSVARPPDSWWSHEGAFVVVFSGLADGDLVAPVRLPAAPSNQPILDHLLELPDAKWNDFYAGVPKLIDFNTAALRAKREKDRKPDTKPSRPLKEYAGKFEEAAYGTAEVALQDDVLTAKWGKYTFRLDHYHYDTFTAVPVAPKADIVTFDRSTFDVQFKLGTDGSVSGLRFLDQDFTPVKPAKK